MNIIEILKAMFLGIIEGITEWLPISSTGHLILADKFIALDMSESFMEMFFFVVQLGAILAVIILFFDKMFPFQFKNKAEPVFRKEVFSTWLKVIVACIPGAVTALLFDDFIEKHLHTPAVIAASLIFYGILFIIVEKRNKKRNTKINSLSDISYYTAFLIGLFQVLSIIPGTSRSGATIIGALIIGVSRIAATEFTFFLAVPAMLGISTIKIIKFGFDFSAEEAIILAVGTITAFLVSVAVIKFLMGYIKKHDFTVFGWYRIVLGILVLIVICM